MKSSHDRDWEIFFFFLNFNEKSRLEHHYYVFVYDMVYGVCDTCLGDDDDDDDVWPTTKWYIGER